MRRAKEHGVANLQRRFLIFRTIRAGADRGVAGMVSPCDFEVLDVVTGDFVERDKAAAAGRIAVMLPVLLLGFRGYRRQRGRLTIEGDGRMRHEHAGKTCTGSDGENGGNGKGSAICRGLACRTAQKRIGERNDRGADTYRQKAGNERPEVQSGFPHRPDAGEDNDEAEEKRAGRLAQQDEQAGDDQRDARRNEVKAAAEGRELAAANGEEQACGNDDRAEHQQP
ncbi:hypothetical protein D3C80_263600 [compost metagenome]